MLLPKAARLLNFQQVAVVALPLVPSPALPDPSGAPQSRDVAAFPTKQVITTRAYFFPAEEVIHPSACRKMCSRDPSSPAQEQNSSMPLGPGGFPHTGHGRGHLCNSSHYFGKTLAACCPADTQPAAGEAELAAGWECWRERD